MIEGVVNDNVESERKFQPIDLSNASSGNWVIARYEGEYFLGLILEITEKKIKQEFNALKNPLELLSPNHWSHTAMFFMIMMIYLEPMLYHLWFLTNQIEGKSNTLILSEDISLWMLCCDTYILNLHYDSVLRPRNSPRQSAIAEVFAEANSVSIVITSAEILPRWLFPSKIYIRFTIFNTYFSTKLSFTNKKYHLHMLEKCLYVLQEVRSIIYV